MMRSCARESREEDIPTEIPPMAGILTITHTTDHRTQRCRQCSIISTAETTGEALNLLDRMPNRNAMWYYASGFANAGIGNNVLAREHAAQAVNMEPNNVQYRQLLNQLDWNSRRYQSNPYGGGYGAGGQSCGTGNMCCDLWCADTLCECMGGDLCSCM